MVKKYLKRKKQMAFLLATILCLGSTNAYAKEPSPTSNATYQITEEANKDIIMENRPISSFWFPQQLLDWNIKKDGDFSYNKSTIPLKKRMSIDKLAPVNNTQNKDTKVVAISIMNSNTSGNSSHGSSSFAANTFSYWQYIDTLVYWGGSSGEGLIVPPSPDVTNAAHKNGVPVLGTVFFPMTAHGGKMEWLNTFLKKDKEGNFPIVDKLIQVANEYGFDGWFINQETEGTKEEPLTKEHAILMQQLIKQLKEKAGNLEIMWYDSMTSDGKMDWQNALTSENQFFLLDDEKEAIADSMFLNFWWTSKSFVEKELLKQSEKKANDLGINPYELYAGIDVQANGVSTPINWNLLEKSSPKKTFTSIGLYCPSWTYFSSETPEDYEKKESLLWVNEKGNPALKTEASKTDWRGISTYVSERSSITQLPLVTNFNLGNGYGFFINGEKVSNREWNNRSLSDVMPTYRWVINYEGKNNLTPSTDYTTAYYGGNSFKFEGNTKAGKQTTLQLFRSDLTLQQDTLFTVAVKANKKTSINALLQLEDGTTKTIPGNQNIQKDWTIVSFDTSQLVGKTIRTISLQLSTKESQKDYSFHLGNLSIAKKETTIVPAVKNLKVDHLLFDEEAMYAGIRLSWNPVKKAISHYEIYRINSNNTKSLLGVSINPCYFVDRLERLENASSTKFEVIAVSSTGKRGTSDTTSMQWPDISLPKANFKASSTLIAPGDSITFTSTSSQNTEELLWKLEGANTETSIEHSPTVTYALEGTYKVSLTAKNKKGEDTKEIEQFITVSKNVPKKLINLSKNKPTEASSSVNEGEASQFAVDGTLEKKWCATGSTPHTLTINLETIKTVSQVSISHAEAGNESPDMNTQQYTIETSTDGVEYKEVVSVTKNKLGKTLDTFPATKAQYIRFTVIKATQGSDSAARIYEVEVYGID